SATGPEIQLLACLGPHWIETAACRNRHTAIRGRIRHYVNLPLRAFDISDCQPTTVRRKACLVDHPMTSQHNPRLAGLQFSSTIPFDCQTVYDDGGPQIGTIAKEEHLAVWTPIQWQHETRRFEEQMAIANTVGPLPENRRLGRAVRLAHLREHDRICF